MKKNALFLLIILPFFLSCAGMRMVRRPSPEIMQPGKSRTGKMASFLLNHNPALKKDYARKLADAYVRESALEGVNHDAAFAQMCLETGYLKFGGLVTPDMNNFCGLGAINPEHPGEVFPSMETGVKAHIQHLKAYASTLPLRGELVDKRFKYVKRGTAPTVLELTGHWAMDPEYGNKIYNIMQRLLHE